MYVRYVCGCVCVVCVGVCVCVCVCVCVLFVAHPPAVKSTVNEKFSVPWLGGHNVSHGGGEPV